MGEFYEQRRKPYLKDLLLRDKKFTVNKNRYYYCYTQTFAPMSLKEKAQHIISLGATTSQIIGCHSMYYTIEYHKKANKVDSNPFAPHIHGILVTKEPLKQDTLKYLQSHYREKMGFNSIVVQEDFDEIPGWLQYCKKEVQFNNVKFKLEHEFYYEVVKSKQIRESDYDDYLEI